MKDDIRGKAWRWAELVYETSFLLPADRATGGLLIRSFAAAAYEAGYADGYEAAKRQKEEDENA